MMRAAGAGGDAGRAPSGGRALRAPAPAVTA
jgi:hypothetical protein